MDIMQPELHEQVSPAPWLVQRGRISLPALIRLALARLGNATADQIVQYLLERGHQVSGVQVARWLSLGQSSTRCSRAKQSGIRPQLARISHGH
jgi:hypothetical protein